MKLQKSALYGAISTGLAGVFIFSSPVQADEWRYVMEEGLTDPQGLYATKFKEEIEENSEHTIEIYPVGTLGESADAMEQAQAGLVQFIDQSPGFTGALIPEAEAFLVPYLQPTDPQAVRTFFKEGKAVKEMFHEIYREHGLELLSIFPEGQQVVTTMKEFRTPADLDGVKIRTMSSPLLLETYKAFGASPIALPWGELIGALKTNMVDGQENPAIWIEAYGLDELTKVMTYTGHAQYTTAVMANSDFYDELSDEDKQLIQDATSAAHDYILDEAVKMDEIGLSKIRESNPEYTIIELSEEERAVFKERAVAVEEAFIDRAGDRGAAIIEQMKADIAAAM
ncbi:TRAP transporter substrate-binding protein DctP [Granulosicoccus antarcticus]|uniref:Ectoine/5-hydroxyectoine-binding periplasmic protein UehA n=1 Tax=Granulosicoccus antarcticus IMCC3135 TaxID=1192854 RepID=A0A2Z2NQU4_9GAMM|nr:TRAP transporter substrate-binding protein DctP [Granulosicoccus antarcticus]ASJ72068.1 Ectoine/5-hydroxyectoine-binding periplasmic protein UehA [Granulosicoccus antarcticus IMCC3135]